MTTHLDLDDVAAGNPVAEQELARLREIENDVASLMEAFPEPCRYDHHGYCQEHFLHEAPCPIDRLRAALEVGR